MPQPSAAVAEELVLELVKRGLSEAIAANAVQAKGADFVRLALAFFDAERAAGRFDKPEAALRSILKHPEEKWNFRQTPDGWQRPPPATDGRQAETAEDFNERMRRNRVEQERYARDGDNGCKTKN
jgi:hypothetical protein